MPTSVFHLLTISPALSEKNLQELKQILGIVALGAFGQQLNVQIVLTEHTDYAVLSLEFPNEQISIAVEIATRLATTMLQLVASLARELGVPTRQSGVPSRRILKLTGLTWHRVRIKLSKLVAALESQQAFIELACLNTSLHLRLTTGRSLGRSASSSVYLCDTVIHRRTTSSGEIARIRCGKRSMSIAVPRDINANAISNGTAISMTNIVGKIQRRLVLIRRCQLSLLCDN